MKRAERKTTKPAPTKQVKTAPKTVPMVKLVGGEERPETAADRREAARTAKVKARKPGGAKAFHLASDMEDDLNEIKRLIDALHLMAEGANADDSRVSSALYAIFNGLETHFEKAKEKREKICHATYGYVFPERETPPPSVADFDMTIATLKMGRAKAKRLTRVAKCKPAKEAV